MAVMRIGRGEEVGDMTQPLILPFGQHRGHPITAIPDDYLFWLCSRGKSTYYKSSHSLDVTWKVPIVIWEAAREEAEKRGFKKIGERWERK